MSERGPHEHDTLVPGYELGESIGRGGFARVYRARQVSLDREVAIKIDSRVLDDSRNRRRFLREATASALISTHPHVISLIDAGTTRDNRPFLVMELCDNGSVSELIKRGGPLPPADALELGIATASALAAAHEKGILHRDIKPSNILIDPYGTPRLGDFGLAALSADGEASVTLEALTPAFAAPEAFEQAVPSKRADVWALGATLYTMVTGLPPRQKGDGSTPTVAEIISSLYQPLPLAPQVGADKLMQVVARATAPQPEQRYADGTQLHSALLALRGEVGRPQTVYAGGDVTRLASAGPPPPGVMQRMPSPASGYSPASVAGPQFFASAGPTGQAVKPARKVWPIVTGVILAILIVIAGVLIGPLLLGDSLNSAEPAPAPPSHTPTADPDTSESPTPEPTSGENAIAAGGMVPASPVCFGGVVVISGNSSYSEIPCDESHAWEAYRVGTLSEDIASAHTDDVMADPAVTKTCTEEAFASYTDQPVDATMRDVFPPSEVSFNAGSRLFYCVADTPESPSTGSFKRT